MIWRGLCKCPNGHSWPARVAPAWRGGDVYGVDVAPSSCPDCGAFFSAAFEPCRCGHAWISHWSSALPGVGCALCACPHPIP